MEPDQDVLSQGTDRRDPWPAWVRSRAARVVAGLLAVSLVIGWSLTQSDNQSDGQSEAPVPEAAAPGGAGLDPVADVGPPAGLATPENQALARQMRRFARSPGAEVGMPWAAEVLVVGEGPVDIHRLVSAKAADRVETWTDPPYLLSPLASARGERLRVDDERHVTCRGQPRRQAAGLEHREWVSLQPRVLDNACRGWWAVDLYLDDDGRVSAVLLRS